MLRVCFLFLLLAGCATNPPIREFTLARTAIESAKQYESDRYAPAVWFKAEENYRRGESAFKKEDYELAQEYFIRSKILAEKAENKSRLRSN